MPSTKVRLKAEWNPDANWFDLVSKIQQRLGLSTTVQELPLTPPIEPEALAAVCAQINPQALAQPALEVPVLSNSDRVKAVRSLTGHSADAVRAILARYDTDHPKNLTPEQCSEVIEILVSYWYQDLNLAVQIPSPEWRSNIQHLQQQGLSEAAAITNWTAQLKLSHPLRSA